MEADEAEEFDQQKIRKNIFDDDISLDVARDILTSSFIHDSHDDDNNVIDYALNKVDIHNCSGVRYATGHSKTMPDLALLATPAVTSTFHPSSSYVSTSVGGQRSSSIRHTHSSCSQYQSSSMAVAGEASNTGQPMFDQLQQEVSSLKRQLMRAKSERWELMPVDMTLRRMMKGEPYLLAHYRSLDRKLALLDAAVKINDGNAITAAVLHLRKTVKRYIFEEELLQRPVAANHYINYLREHCDHDELLSTLLFLGNKEEAAMVKYWLVCSTKDVNEKILRLKSCLRDFFEVDDSLSAQTNIVNEHIDLLEIQQPIEHEDARKEMQGQCKLFIQFPRRCSLIGMPLVTSLYYCCLYHYYLPENNLASPLALKEKYKISERQYIWTAVRALAKAQAWIDIQQLFTTKRWFGGKTMKASIGFDKVVEILLQFQAPKDVTSHFLDHVDNLDTRLSLSVKSGCDGITVNTLVKQRNRVGLEEFVTKHGNTVESDYARRVLMDEVVRWK